MARSIEVLRVSERSPEEKEFIAFPKRLYRGCPQWVPWFDLDMRMMLRRRHPYFRQAAEALLRRLQEWARGEGLGLLRGPMLLGGASGSGILVQGFEHRAAMTMMPYNYPYYPRLLEELGFRKHVDLYSMDLPPDKFRLPDRVRAAAEKVLARGRFRVLEFRSKRDLRKVADRIAGLYNATLADHLEDYPLSDAELEQSKKDLLVIADPRLVKILAYDGQIVGYLLGFPDLSRALQKKDRKSV